MVKHHALLPCHRSAHSWDCPVLPTPFRTTCGSFPRTVHATYAFRNIVYSFARYIATCQEKAYLVSFTDLQSFSYTFQQPADLFDTLYTPPKPFTTFYNHLPTIHFWAKWSLPALLVVYKTGTKYFPNFLKTLENFKNVQKININFLNFELL